MDGERPDEPVRQDQPQRDRPAGWDDVLKGWEFCATLQLRTPLAVLEHHGELIEGAEAVLPTYGPGWAGIWTPKTKSWAELGAEVGLALPEFPPGQMASQIGLVPEDGGAFLTFLKAYRRIVERAVSVEEKEREVQALARRPEYSEIAAKLGPSLLDECFDPAEEAAIERLEGAFKIGYVVAANLYEAGLADAVSVASASDATLRAVQGVGPKTLSKIRRATGPNLSDGAGGSRTPD